jgi:RNA polymerase sigma-70 factor (ECF subfamily)
MHIPDTQPHDSPDPDDNHLDWDDIYRQQMPRIYNFFRYRLGSDEVAQDLTATTFTKAWRARDQYDADRGVFTAWLFTIARNVANDYLRKSMRRNEVPLDAIWNLATDQNVEGEARKRRRFQKLHALLKTLSARDQEIIALKYGANMTNRDIAKATGLTESNVGTIIYRTVNKLRQHWELSDNE